MPVGQWLQFASSVQGVWSVGGYDQPNDGYGELSSLEGRRNLGDSDSDSATNSEKRTVILGEKRVNVLTILLILTLMTLFFHHTTKAPPRTPKSHTRFNIFIN